MGADMYLNPPDPPRQDRVVVKIHRAPAGWRVVAVYGPYTQNEAVSARKRLTDKEPDPVVGTVGFMVRKMERD